MKLFELAEFEPEVLSETGALWIICGSVPCDGEDSVMVYLADDESQVADAFEAFLYSDLEPEVKDSHIKESGMAVFINYVQKLANQKVG